MNPLLTAKLVIGALTLTLIVIFYSLWRYEVHAFATFKAQVEKIGEAAKAEKAAIELGNKQRVKEIEDELPKKLATARANAVANYLARVRLDPRGGSLSRASASTKTPDGAAQERLSVGEQDLIGNAAEDAAVILEWQKLARSVPNCLKTEVTLGTY